MELFGIFSAWLEQTMEATTCAEQSIFWALHLQSGFMLKQNHSFNQLWRQQPPQ